MLALLNGESSTEVFLPSGETVTLPQAVLNGIDRADDLRQAAKWAFKANLISHAEYLRLRDMMSTSDTSRPEAL